MADLVERRTACMCQDVEIGSHAVSVGLKVPSHMQAYSAARVTAGLSPDIAVDACLVGEIRSLWSKGIRTYGCCCGHNKVRGMINVHEDDASAMHAMGYEQWPTEEGYHPWTFYPQSTRADVAALEAESSKGERRGLERAIALVEDSRLADRGDGPSYASAHNKACTRIANRLHRLIPEAPVRDGWQPIETAPETAEEFLLFCSDTKESFVGYKWRQGTYCYAMARDGTFIMCKPTHWRPLPAPPQDNREG